MKKHEVKTVIDQALERLARALEEGRSEQLTAHLSRVVTRHPMLGLRRRPGLRGCRR